MIQRRKPLRRKKPLHCWRDQDGAVRSFQIGRNPLVRTAIPKMSERRKRESRIYSAKRKAFLSEHPICEMPSPLGVGLCRMRSMDVHHSKGRYGGNYLNESTWIALCREHHDWIHRHPKEARERGLLK